MKDVKALKTLKKEITRRLDFIPNNFSTFWRFGAAWIVRRKELCLWLLLSLLANFTLGHYEFGRAPPPPPIAKEIWAHAIYCHDGDTCTLQADAPDSPRFKLRLAGIDAPEVDWANKRGQIYGNEAKKRVEGWVLGKQLKIALLGNDRYGRYLGRIYVGDFEVNKALAEQGFAYAYRSNEKNARENQIYVEAEERARKKGLGFWALANRPEEPWRHRHPDQQNF